MIERKFEVIPGWVLTDELVEWVIDAFEGVELHAEAHRFENLSMSDKRAELESDFLRMANDDPESFVDIEEMAEVIREVK